MNTQTKITLLNPFSVSLKKHPFMEVNNLIYQNGEYKIYRYAPNHYVHTFKNIVITERGKANKELINNLVTDTKPTGEAALYHDYERPKGAILEGIEAAKNLNFQIQ